jgi:hypothetical protein
VRTTCPPSDNMRVSNPSHNQKALPRCAPPGTPRPRLASSRWDTRLPASHGLLFFGNPTLSLDRNVCRLGGLLWCLRESRHAEVVASVLARCTAVIDVPGIEARAAQGAEVVTACLDQLVQGHDSLPSVPPAHAHPAVRLTVRPPKRGLEGIVSKKKDAPYRSGKCDWIKVKCAEWRAANKDRGDLFQQTR